MNLLAYLSSATTRACHSLGLDKIWQTPATDKTATLAKQILPPPELSPKDSEIIKDLKSLEEQLSKNILSQREIEFKIFELNREDGRLFHKNAPEDANTKCLMRIDKQNEAMWGRTLEISDLISSLERQQKAFDIEATQIKDKIKILKDKLLQESRIDKFDLCD